MHKYIHLLRFFSVCLLLNCLFISHQAIAKTTASETISSGWLVDSKHPAVSVKMQLTGKKEPRLKAVDAVLQVQLQDDWKTYWRSPGDSGEAPRFDFSQSTNISDVVWGWPAPTRYNVFGVDTLGYKGVVNFPITLYLQDPSKPAVLKSDLTLASCTNICVLSDYKIELSFLSEALTINDDALSVYYQAVTKVPVKLDKQADARFAVSVLHSDWDNKKQLLHVEIENEAGWHSPDIFVDSAADMFDITFSAPQMTINENILKLQIGADSWGDKVDLNKQPLNLTVIDKNMAVELLTTPQQGRISTHEDSLLSMFFIALIGGFILNIMPCVLPVLGMKLSSILAAQGINRTLIRKQFLASSAGILSSFWLLAAFLLILKLSGQALGWGIQFQNPYFIGFMVVITALFAANMLDIFTIQLPVSTQTWLATRGANSYIGYFLQGMFATLLATPCSAPFLGTAVAFSLAASSLQLFIIFTALGLGMALPWLLIALFPVIASWLPKPGNWMNSLKIFFALLILITCYWLLSLLSSFIGAGGAFGLALLLSVVFLFFIAKKHGRKLFFIVSVVILAVAVSGKTFVFLTGNDGGQTAGMQWQPLSRALIEQQVEQGKVVFADVTADWCVTCKANKIGVILQEPVYSRLQEEDIVTIRGDWTLASDSITEYLHSYGRVAVPFNIVYGPAAPQGIPLPTILTPDAVLAAIDKATGEK